MSEQLLDENPDIVSFFETIVDDVPDIDSEYILLNQADALIRRARPWEILKKLDSSKSRIDGEDLSSTKSLPADFDRPNKLFVGTLQRPPLKRVRFEEQQMYQNAAGLYMLDYKNSLFAITAPTWTGTIYNHYLYKPARLSSDGANSTLAAPVFPSDFFPIYAYKMAEIQMGGVDFDFISAQSVTQWVRSYKELWDTMISWDGDLKDEGNVFRSEGYEDLPPLDLGLLGR